MNMDLGFAPDPPKPVEPQAPAATVTLTQEQFDQLLARIGQQQQTADYAAALTGAAPEPVKVDLSELPDPAADPSAFRSSLEDVFEQSVERARSDAAEQAQAQMAMQMEQERLADTAWEMIKRDYPDVAARPKAVQHEVRDQMEALNAQGLNPYVMLQRDMEGSVKTIVENVRATLGLREDPDRTDVLGAGGLRRAAADTPVTTSLIQELQKIQAAEKIY
jgi:hypothetical protein